MTCRSGASEGGTEVPSRPDVELQGESAALTPELRDRLLYYAMARAVARTTRRAGDRGRRKLFRVSRDPAHQVLREFDPQGREGDLACGAVVTNLCVGARAFGFDAEVRWRPATV
jgi:hypothetical protein